MLRRPHHHPGDRTPLVPRPREAAARAACAHRRTPSPGDTSTRRQPARCRGLVSAVPSPCCAWCACYVRCGQGCARCPFRKYPTSAYEVPRASQRCAVPMLCMFSALRTRVCMLHAAYVVHAVPAPCCACCASPMCAAENITPVVHTESDVQGSKIPCELKSVCAQATCCARFVRWGMSHSSEETPCAWVQGHTTILLLPSARVDVGTAAGELHAHEMHVMPVMVCISHLLCYACYACYECFASSRNPTLHGVDTSSACQDMAAPD